MPSFWVFANSSENLNKAFEARFSNPTVSQELLVKIDVSELTESERIRYRYVEAYHTAITDSLDSALVILKSLSSSQVDDAPLLVAILSSELAVTVGLKNWTDAFSVLNQLENLLYKSNKEISLSDRQNAEFGIANFYEDIEQYDDVLKITSKLLHEPISAELKCKIASIHLPAKYHTSQRADAAMLLNRFQGVCDSNSTTIFSHVYRFEKIKIMWALEQSNDVLEQALALEPDLIRLGYPPLLRLQRSLIAQIALALGNTDLSLEYALKVIGDGSEKGYYKPVLVAYQVAARAYSAKGDYKKSTSYYEKYIRLNQIKFSEEASLQLAIQHAKFEVDSYESEVQALDNQNKLLQTQAELARKRIENSVLALTIAGLMLTFLLYWSWKAKKLQKRLQYAANVDFLTKIYNRGYLTEFTIKRLTKLKAKGSPLSILLFDLDHFKRINDSYGHQVGDWALKTTIRTVTECLEESQIVGRMGGEEFAILLEGKTANEALNIAEQCRAAIQSIDTQPTKQIFTITASFGVSDTSLVGYNFDNLMSAADLALFQSKRQGRNKVYEYSNTLSFSKNVH